MPGKLERPVWDHEREWFGCRQPWRAVRGRTGGWLYDATRNIAAHAVPTSVGVAPAGKRGPAAADRTGSAPPRASSTWRNAPPLPSPLRRTPAPQNPTTPASRPPVPAVSAAPAPAGLLDPAVPPLPPIPGGPAPADPLAAPPPVMRPSVPEIPNAQYGSGQRWRSLGSIMDHAAIRPRTRS